MNQRISNLLRVLVVTILVIGLLTVAGIRFTHPKSGLRSALGAASSSVAIYNHTKSVSKGDNVVVITGQDDADPALAVVNNIDGDNLDIQIGNSLQRVSVKSNLQGKLLLVVPFAGYIAGFLNL